ncbi:MULTISPECIES: hypothetical protein [unclassified Mycobacterium]|nr:MULTISPECIES: hypothetical protein [unclassified Mycobacterium]
MGAVETQADVWVRAGALKSMAGEPHDRGRVVDAQPVAFSSEPHFSGGL